LPCNQGSTNGAIQPRHCRTQGSTNGAKTSGHRQRLPSEEEEEGRASHHPGKMRSVPKGAHNKRRGAVHDRGLQRQRVWLVMAAGGVRRGVNTTISQKRDAQRAGCRAPKRKGRQQQRGRWRRRMGRRGQWGRTPNLCTVRIRTLGAPGQGQMLDVYQRPDY
jgi:hypothetical protein